MTREEAIDIIRAERECVYRQGRTGECCRDDMGCGACDLVQEDTNITEAYDMAIEALKEKRPHGEWEALGFQQGYAFCRCSNCHKTMRLYRDSKNEFCCIADIRKKVVSCMYCGADMREGEAE